MKVFYEHMVDLTPAEVADKADVSKRTAKKYIKIFVDRNQVTHVRTIGRTKTYALLLDDGSLMNNDLREVS